MLSVSEKAKLFDEIERCAAEMPKGYYIELHVKRGSGYVDLITPDGSEPEFPSNRETIIEQVTDALEYAKQLASRS